MAQRERQFGLSVGTVLLAIAAYFWWRGSLANAALLGGIGAVLLFAGYLQPRMLKYPSAGWWTVAAFLGYVNARIILVLIFALLLAPLGVMWRIVGRDPLARRRASWGGWSPYPERYRDHDHYKRMY